MAPHHHRTMSDSLVVSAEAHPDKEVVVVGGTERYTYGRLHDTALRTARLLQDHGVQRGDRVVVFADNSWACVASIFGTWLAGAVVVVVNAQTKADKLAYLLADSDAKVMVTEAKLARVFRPVVGTLPILCAGKAPEGTVELGEALAAVEPKPAPHGCVATDLAAFIYTSGSTGEPKGVVMTHQNMTFTVASLIEYLRLGPDERIINLLPLAFDYGLYQLLMTVRLGATLVLEAGFGFPEVIRRRLRDEQVTVVPGVPTVFATLLAGDQTPYPSVRRVTNTAAALSPELIPRLAALFPEALIYKMYGLTECKRVLYLEPEQLAVRPASVGKAIPGTEVFLLSPDGAPVPAGEAGILHVRGPHVMVGYWNKPEQTAQMIKPGRFPGDRILCAQDWFKMDEEGYLYFLGRSDDIIKSRGEKVSPVEVENALYGLTDVREAAVIGVEDPVLGQAIRAYVALEAGSALTAADIRRHCQGCLENYMVPAEVVILEELPKTDTGKIRKKGLLEEQA
ncbi:MAG: class I adenylate-forming enzyme family protein [Acidimicrobiia bacterium]